MAAFFITVFFLLQPGVSYHGQNLGTNLLMTLWALLFLLDYSLVERKKRKFFIGHLTCFVACVIVGMYWFGYVWGTYESRNPPQSPTVVTGAALL